MTVDVIDEYGIGSENQGGKFHLYEDGRIVREFYGEKGKSCEFVDSIPEDRVGGVRELDSISDGTPLEILEYLSLAAVVRKQGTKVIRKSIKKADFDALVRILKEEKGNVVLPGKKAGKSTGELNKDLAKAYLRDIEAKTGRKVNKEQIHLIKEDLRNKNYEKLTPKETAKHRSKFTSSLKDKLIAEWEEKTNQKWPRYTEEVLDKNGEVARSIGQPYDAHHIIENNFGGPHE
ncbi:hypothetical protein [Cytobacillus sp. FSL H8-0458]|uniref:hypothetical protein n=1 Tax=Cytobacillus sp. FSL H8-0458 TaxID=2975346 RepID=UPI0030F87C42